MRRFDQYHFAENLTRAIAEAGYSTRDIADYLDVSVQAVYGWLDGSKRPKVDNLVPLSDLIKRSLDELIPSYEAKWEGATIKGKAIEQRRLVERKSICIDKENLGR